MKMWNKTFTAISITGRILCYSTQVVIAGAAPTLIGDSSRKR